MYELVALFLAGLSLFFTGVGGVKTKLGQLSGRKFRQVLIKVTDRPVLAGLMGAAFGAVTQSASAVAFILSGMVAAGLITLRRALPVVASSNVGTALLVFLAAFDMRLATLFLIGVTGLAIHFKMLPRLEVLFGALFAIGLLFLGLGLMKEAFAPLPKYEWFQALAGFLASWPLATFFLGAALRMVIQSSSAIGVIAIALQGSGLFTEFQSLMLICGAGPGVALSGLFLGGTLSGPPKQIVLYQGIINFLSGCLLGLAFFASEIAGHTFILKVIDTLGRDASDRIAWTFLLNMSGCLVIGLLLAPIIEPLLRKLAPPTVEQALSQPVFIHDEALEVPEAAVDLVEKEQSHLYDLSLRILNTIREESGETDRAEVLYSAIRALREEISSFLAELVKRQISGDIAFMILALERRQENLNTLTDALHQFVDACDDRKFTPKVQALVDRMAESLHLIFTSAQDAWHSRDEMDLDLLLKLTEDRGEMMERLRQSYQVHEAGSSLDQSSALSYATTLFERMVWLLRQVGLSLRGPR